MVLLYHFWDHANFTRLLSVGVLLFFTLSGFVITESASGRKSRPSLFAAGFSGCEREVLPGIESGALARDDMIEIVACLRRWEHDGTWNATYAG